MIRRRVIQGVQDLVYRGGDQEGDGIVLLYKDYENITNLKIRKM